LRPNSPRAVGPSAARGRLPSSAWDAGSLRARRNPDSAFARSHSGAPVGGRGSSRTMRHQPRDKVRKVRRASILRPDGGSCQVRLSGRYDGRRAGAVAERLGRGLQSLVHRFESGPRLVPHESSRCSGLIPAPLSTRAKSRAMSATLPTSNVQKKRPCSHGSAWSGEATSRLVSASQGSARSDTRRAESGTLRRRRTLSCLRSRGLCWRHSQLQT
jgi:hypothetical protein